MAPHSTMENEHLIELIAGRFQRMPMAAAQVSWEYAANLLTGNGRVLQVLHAMEASGGQPALIGLEASTNRLIFCDSSPESPVGRRSLCFDENALLQRKENKPAGSAMGMAIDMGVHLTDEATYRLLQQVAGPVDTKTSSWIATPPGIRHLGGAIFADYRYGQVFVYHNSAGSYYASRGFRGMLLV